MSEYIPTRALFPEGSDLLESGSKLRQHLEEHPYYRDGKRLRIDAVMHDSILVSWVDSDKYPGDGL